jgi:quercetin dioxygenase-like cupin family protein
MEKVMSVMREEQSTVHEMHGARFSSYVAPSRCSTELCAWKVAVAPGVPGQEHRVSREEVFLVLAGTPTLTLDGTTTVLEPGQVAFAAVGTRVRLANHGEAEAALWVSTSVGLEAALPDGSTVRPPWTR